MFRHLFHLTKDGSATLQQQVREQISKAIIEGHIPLDLPLPSTRELAAMLSISRNTAVIAYQDLVADGYLISRDRSGYYVDPQIFAGKLRHTASDSRASEHTPDWQHFIKHPLASKRPLRQHQWQQAPYPFIYGQLDPNLFPLKRWRECVLDSLRPQAAKQWSSDHYDADDPLLIEQIRSRLLPGRGIWAQSDEILITVGAQHALSLLLTLLLNNRTVFGLENPGYPDLQRMAALTGSSVRSLQIDQQGLMTGAQLTVCDLIFTTPSHQFPTTVTMPIARRRQLLQQAAESNFLIIEDDYESETSFGSHPTPALKSLDQDQRVIYIGSLSKTLSPGLRLGYIVAPAPLIRELRELRHVMLRHPPRNNQLAAGLFLERGYHDSLVRNLREVYQARWTIMKDSLAELLPDSSVPPVFGGSAYWIESSAVSNSQALQQQAQQQGILLESGARFYSLAAQASTFRLGYSSIATDQIRPGLEKLAALIHSMKRADKM